MSRALVLPLLLLAAGCSATEPERKEVVIQSALDAAYLACQTALNDPRMTWEPGARDYCLRIVNASCEGP